MDLLQKIAVVFFFYPQSQVGTAGTIVEVANFQAFQENFLTASGTKHHTPHDTS